MSASTSGSGGRAGLSLWQRAPMWRLSIYCAGLATLLCIVYPPKFSFRKATWPPPTINMASYSAPAENHTAAPQDNHVITQNLQPPPAAVSAPTPQNATAAKSAQLSLDIPSGTPNKGSISGLDPALLGRTYHGQIQVDGFGVPLPTGEWAVLATTSAKSKINPENTGVSYFLGRIEHKVLVGAVVLSVLRSPSSPGSGFAGFQGCGNPDNIHNEKEEIVPFNHQACWVMHNYFTPPLQQWADKSIKIDNLARAAAGDLSSKGVTYPQDFVTVQFFRAESCCMLDASYLFSPDQEHIRSTVVPSFRDADWFGRNLQRFPDKIAYTERLQRWATSFWPTFKAAFDEGRNR